MRNLRRKWFWVTLAATFGFALLVLDGLADFDLSRHDISERSFEVAGHTLSGTLVLPRDVENPPVALIVHGDGPQDRFSGEGYLPLINALADAGIGVFTWDKPGIGASGGNWLDQSMPDRADEVLAAYRMVQAGPGIAPDRVGLLGFSQAGWVIPQVTSEITPAFTVLIGAAVNWQRQGDYYTGVRLRNDGMANDQIAQEIAAEAAMDEITFAPDAKAPDGFDPARFAFIQRNRMADASRRIATMQGPVLALWGAEDLNVAPDANAADYKRLLPDPGQQTAEIWPQATHSLLRSRFFNTQLVEQWSWPVQVLFVGMGRKAYAPGLLDHITSWIKNHL